MLTIEDLKKQGLIAYTYLRGSHSQNLNNEDSDIDLGGVYFAPIDILFGLGDNYQEEVSDEKHDETYFEFGKWMRLLAKGNPNALESLFANEKAISGEVHPVIQHIIENRDKFLSKEVVKALSGYAYNQIKKARGLGKKITTAHELGDRKMERKDVLDFCYVADYQGSMPVKKFLEENHLNQKYCGVVNIPNMPHTYGVYYDFAAYFKFEVYDKDKEFWEENFCDETFQSWCFDMRFRTVHSDKFMDYDYCIKTYERVVNKEFFGYKGIVEPDDISKSNEVRLSSIPKGEKPIFIMQYNKDAYTSHCKEYREYKEWEENRNQKRFSKAVEAGYNQKNMCHCVRLLTMAKEISEGKGFNLWRTDDRDFLMAIKNGEYTYEYLIDYAEKLLADVNANLPTSNLPDEVDKDFVDSLTVEGRYMYYMYYGDGLTDLSRVWMF